MNIKKYKHIATASLLVMISTFAVAVFLGRGAVSGNIWDEGGAPLFLMPIISLSMITMFWAFIKSKGRSGWWVLTLLTGVIGLVIILLLKNKNDFNSLETP